MTRWLLLGLTGAALLALAILVTFPRFTGKPADAPPLTGSMEAFTPTGRPVPAITMETPDGKHVALSDLTGKVVLLNLWATWCAPCVREMPTLDRLQAKLGGSSFEVVALSSDRAGASAVEPFFREHGLDNLAIYLDPTGAAGRALGVRALPSTLLIDSAGREVGRLEGVAEWDSPEAIALIRHVMGRDG